MEFYYNSGLPQRQRRTGRDSRPNALNKDVPSFLVYPDGSHSLGVISPAATRPEEDTGNQDSTITGPFVVWADPGSSCPAILPTQPEALQNQLSADIEHAYYVRHTFYLVLVINIAFACMILADAVANHRSTAAVEARLSAPPLELTATCFAVGILAKLVGAWGVYASRIRCISAFIAVNLLLAILNLVWTGALMQLVAVALDLLLVAIADQARARLMGAWFSASR